jgi:kumamolisin
MPKDAVGEELVELAGSHRDLPAAPTLADAPADDTVSVTVALRRRNEIPDELVHGPGQVDRDEFVANYGAHPNDIGRVTAFAERNGLRVTETDAASRRVKLEGSVTAMQQAFGVRLRAAQSSGLRVREGKVMIPASLADAVVGVFGLDNRPQAHPRLLQSTDIAAAAPALTPADYTATNLAALYSFPSGNGSGQTIGILELGGGYNQKDLDAYFSSLGLATPSVTNVSVDGAKNSPGGDADAEVALDMQVSGGCAPSAKIAMYWSANTDQGFIDAASTAVHDQASKPSTISISWGAPEADWTGQAMTSMDGVFADAAALGITVFVAAGDHGSGDDGPGGLAHADFPASSPNAVGCGGTHLDARGNVITNEVVWNNNNGWATGGGVSDQFAVPTWQQGAGVPASVNPGHRVGRGVPDVAGAADGTPGFRIYLNGAFTSVGGTSGVAPLWAGLTARLNQALGHNLSSLNSLMYQRQTGLGGFRDITSGNNGAYSATAGWDACTGLGSPNGADLLAALRGPYPMTWQLVGNTAGFGQVADGRPIWIADFSGVGHAQVLFYFPGDHNWWLGTVAGGQLSWRLVGNTAGFGQVWDGRPFWIGDFSGVGHAQVLFYFPGDKNWWLGTVGGNGQLTWQLVGNTAGFGQVADGRPFWIGDFSGVGHAQVLFYFPGDHNWWLGTVASNGQLTWELAGNTGGFGQVWDGRPFWTGNFTVSHTQIMFYFPGDKNWWLGTVGGNGQLTWQLVGNTAGFGQVSDGRPFWIGDFAGAGHAQVMFYFPGDHNWWLGTITGGKLNWELAGNTAGFGQVADGRPFWTGNFTVAHPQILFYYPGDKNWWLGTVGGNGQLTWQLLGNTAGFGQVADKRPIWIGDFAGAGHTQVMFYFPGDHNWWLGNP